MLFYLIAKMRIYLMVFFLFDFVAYLHLNRNLLSYLFRDVNGLINGQSFNKICLTLLNDYNVAWYYRLLKNNDYFICLNMIEFLNDCSDYSHTFEFKEINENIVKSNWPRHIITNIRKLFVMMAHIGNESYITSDPSKMKSLPYKQRNVSPLLFSYVSYCQSVYHKWRNENNTSLVCFICLL